MDTEMLIQAVKEAKNSEFKPTAIKVECEGYFNRSGGEEECNYCDEGRVDCEECGGTGTWECQESHDQLRNQHGELVEGEYEDSCDECEGGMVQCGECDGSGQWGCEECGGGWHTGDASNGDLKTIQDKLLAKLVPLGLARKMSDNEREDSVYARYGYEYRWLGALKFFKTYFDSTVDTEVTFTLSIEDERNILLLPKIVEAFVELGQDIGYGIEVHNAGMHMAFLATEDCKYPVRVSDLHYARYKNFKRSMILLMPALFFLASHDTRCRRLTYRIPHVGCQDFSHFDHNSAINYTGGALEFRVFETCYDKPEAILDNLAVMLKCLRFWTFEYTRNHLQRVANNVLFGLETGNQELERLYVTNEHIDLLNRGLKLIKPDYYSIKQLKTERGFKVTKKITTKKQLEALEIARQEYKKYQNRIGWELVMQKNNYIQQEYIHLRNSSSEITQEAIALAEEMAEQHAEREKLVVEPQRSWVKTNLSKFAKAGEWELREESA